MKELNEVELREVEGGFGSLAWFILGIIVAELLDRNSRKDFNEGFDAATK